MTFAVGDSVKLKSGGPVITVIAVDQTAGSVACSWFNNRTTMRETFPSAALERVDQRHKTLMGTLKPALLRQKLDMDQANQSPLRLLMSLGQDGSNIAIAAVLIILLLVEDGDKALQAQMQNAYAMMQVKQALRNLLDQLDEIQLPVSGKSADLLMWSLRSPDKDEISELGSMALQMLMIRSKLLQTASDIEKALSDMATQIIQNIKQ